MVEKVVDVVEVVVEVGTHELGEFPFGSCLLVEVTLGRYPKMGV